MHEMNGDDAVIACQAFEFYSGSAQGARVNNGVNKNDQPPHHFRCSSFRMWILAEAEKNEPKKLNCQFNFSCFCWRPSISYPIDAIHQLLANDMYHFCLFFSISLAYFIPADECVVLACKSYSNFNLPSTAWELFWKLHEFEHGSMNYLYFHVNGRMSAASYKNQKHRIVMNVRLVKGKKTGREKQNKLYHYACECGFSVASFQHQAHF